jgi:type II secretory pathway pseudopilin PulG
VKHITPRSGVTVVELVIVVSMLLILVAVMLPVLRSARERSKEVACTSNLMQIHAAIAVYQNEFDGDGRYGTLEEMGLPPDLGALHPSYLPSRSTYACLVGRLDGAAAVYTRMFHGADIDAQIPRWPDYAREYLDEAILVADLNHDREARHIASPYLDHRGIGLYLGGHARTVVKQGDPTMRLWWNSR